MSDVFARPIEAIGKLTYSSKYENTRSIGIVADSDDLEFIVNSLNNYDKLVEALQSAMNYIKECPCDPDIYPEQLEAWNKLQSLNIKELPNDK